MQINLFALAAVFLAANALAAPAASIEERICQCVLHLTLTPCPKRTALTVYSPLLPSLQVHRRAARRNLGQLLQDHRLRRKHSLSDEEEGEEEKVP